MRLRSRPILILPGRAPSAHALVAAVSGAHGDVVFAGNAVEPLQRPNQFRFDAAVFDWADSDHAVTAELLAQDVPFCPFGTPASGPASVPKALVVTDLEQVVPMLVAMMGEKYSSSSLAVTRVHNREGGNSLQDP
jgi:hypothetical protein